MNRLSAALVLTAFFTAAGWLGWAVGRSSVAPGELPAACRELVTAADQALIGAGQTVTDDATNTSHSGLTRLQREAQLNTIADRYERARDDCLEASR